MRRTIVLILGLLLLVLPALIGLSDAGALALGLFLLASLFWIAEPLPIYATSFVVFLGQLLLLSSSAPLVIAAEFPYAAAAPSSKTPSTPSAPPPTASKSPPAPPAPTKSPSPSSTTARASRPSYASASST